MLALVGIFTVAGPLSYFLVAMVHHPHWQAAAQREIDEACEGRLPTLDDTPNLPILRACITPIIDRDVGRMHEQSLPMYEQSQGRLGRV